MDFERITMSENLEVDFNDLVLHGTRSEAVIVFFNRILLYVKRPHFAQGATFKLAGSSGINFLLRIVLWRFNY